MIKTVSVKLESHELSRDDLEKTVLSYFLFDGEKIYKKIPAWLNDTYFINSSNKAIFIIIQEHLLEDIPISYNRIIRKHKIATSLLDYILNQFDSYYFMNDTLLELRNRHNETRTSEIMNKCLYSMQKGENYMFVKRQMEEELSQLNSEIKTEYSMYDKMKEIMVDYEKVASGEIDYYLKTGLQSIDRKIFLNNGGLHIVAGRPGSGKSVFGLQIAVNVLLSGKSVMMFSFEMKEKELLRRCYAMEAKVDLAKIITGRMDRNERERCDKVINKFKSVDFYMSDAVLNMCEIENLCIEKKPDFIVIDYLQQVLNENKAMSEYSSVSDVSRRFKLLAMRLDIPILAVAQVNRAVDARTTAEPLLSDLRNSGQIEQDADSITFIVRDKEVNELLAQFVVAKQRNAGTGKLAMKFIKNQVRFEEADEDEIAYYTGGIKQ